MNDVSSSERWQENRTTFQRVYDLLVGSQAALSAQEVAERASCSEPGARSALEQLVEMGIVTRHDGRPATYRRNDSYLRWKRVESLVADYSVDELRDRLAELVATDEAFQEQYGVPDPEAVSSSDTAIDAQDALETQWADLNEWRTVRRDIRLLRRAVDRAGAQQDDGVPA
jgi:predicted transcriptional regulator